MRLSLHSDLPTADPYLPGHGDRSWSAAHYALDLDYDLAGNQLRAEAVIDAVADEDLTRVVLDLAGLDVAKVTVDGRAPAKYAARSNRLVLTLRAPVTRGRRSAWSSSTPAPRSRSSTSTTAMPAGRSSATA